MSQNTTEVIYSAIPSQAVFPLPTSLIVEELEGLYGAAVLAEMAEILTYYDIYDHGAKFFTDSKGDYTPSDLRYKEARKLINKEARFLFSKPPDMQIEVPYDRDNPAAKETASAQMSALQDYIDRVFDATDFVSKLVKAAKDCFIGKRVAYFVNFDEVKQRITVDFVPSLEFVYETDPEDITQLTKIVTFYQTNDTATRTDQRIYKKKYWMQDGVCWIAEAIYDGTGALVEELTPDRATRLNFIPAGVILNDGLTGDAQGQSEIESLADYESWFSRLANADIDAERQGMNPVRYAIDINPDTTTNLSLAAGSFWDLQSDPNGAEAKTGTVGVLETSMGYTAAVNSTLSRLRSTMLEELDIPDVSAEALKGVVSSGKTLKAIYWSLIVRCDEKMLAWRPALRGLIKALIEGGRVYPLSAAPYTTEPLPDVEYTITVDNQYPLPDDEADEKTIDMSEVNNQVMSRKAYLKKWRGLTDEEANQELQQIALEREMLENSYGAMPPWRGTEEQEE